MLNIEQKIEKFFQYIVESKIDIYNEFSLQHELGIFLRKSLVGFKVQFERNISFFDEEIDKSLFDKKEMDICIFNNDKSEKYAIELKFPQNGQYPEQMFSFVKDIAFMEQVKERIGFNQTFAVTLAIDENFHKGQKIDGIYRYFRSNDVLTGKIQKPTGNPDKQKTLEVKGRYKIQWKNIADWNDTTNCNDKENPKKPRFYIVKI
jgi:hypothetical protein